MFGFKKKTVEDILSDIQKLGEEERANLMQALSGDGGDTKPTAEPQEPTAEPQETPVNSPVQGESEPVGQTDGTAEETPTNAQEQAETPIPEQAEAQPVEPTPVQEPTQAESEQTETPPVQEPIAEQTVEQVAEQPAPLEDKSKELIDAQTARIDSLESQLAAMKEILDNIVSNQDNKDFGASPTPDENKGYDNYRNNAVIQGYAPRHANDYLK